MKDLKKILCLLLVALLSVAVLAACGGNADGGDKDGDKQNNESHTHKAAGEWLVDKDNHWKVCEEDGEKVDEAAHNLEAGKCSVCGVEVKKDGDTVDVYKFDDHENWIWNLHYEADGKTVEKTIEYKYDTDGNIETMKMNTAGKLIYEAEYAVDSEGYNYEKKSTQYNDDGTQDIFEYDEKGDTLREAKIKADGAAEYDYTIVHQYGEDGKKVSEKTYSGEKLVKEAKYIIVFADSWGGGSYNIEITTYNDDGTKTVQVYNESGEIVG